VALFRAGNDEAFRVIHDRYRKRLFAYTRQMLTDRQDAEDALQDIFVRAYASLRASDRELALRAWLYRVAHNRCIDHLRRPAPPPPEVIELIRPPVHDPIAEADRRESLRRLIADVRRLPDQQRSALLMRELGGMSYVDMAAALGVTVPAVKSLLVRARLALGQAVEARDTACSEIREELIVAHDRGLRPNATARRHMRDCAGCREFRHDLRGVSRRFAALVPTLGPLGVVANLIGAGGAGGGALGAGTSAVGGAAAAGGAAGSGSAIVGLGAIGAGAGHVATLLAAAVVTAGGAVAIQHTIVPSHHAHHARAAAIARPSTAAPPPSTSTYIPPTSYQSQLAQASTPAPMSAAAVTSPTVGAGQGSSTSSDPVTITTPTTLSSPSRQEQRPTGGSSAVISVGGVAPSGSASTTTTPTSSSTTGTNGTSSGTSTTGQTGQAPTVSSTTTTSTSTTSPSSSGTTSSPPTSGSSSSTTGTGSSSTTTTDGSTTPSQ
jgi:RNA polymerase sigma factor (sigma-70 family)